MLTFPSQFGGGNAPISAVGAAFYRGDTNQVYLFSRDGSQYTIWNGGSNFTAAFDVEAFRADFPALQQDVYEDTPLVYLDNG